MSPSELAAHTITIYHGALEKLQEDGTVLTTEMRLKVLRETVHALAAVGNCGEKAHEPHQ